MFKLLLLLHQGIHERAARLDLVALLFGITKGLCDDFRGQAFVALFRGHKSGFKVQDGVHAAFCPLVVQKSVF